MFSGPLKLKPEEDKCSYLLIWVGEKGRDVYNTWTLGDDERKKLKTFYDKFEGYVTPKANPVLARYKFHNEVQDQDESVDQFVTELRLLAKDCGFSDTDEMIRDRIVFGTSSRKVRERLINEGATLTLSKAIDIARTVETFKATLESMEKQTSEVYSIRRFPRDGQKSKQSGDTRKCGNCGGKWHDKAASCPAYGQKCQKCQKSNHFAKACRSRKLQTDSIDTRASTDPTDFFIETVTSTGENTPDQAFVMIEIGPTNTTTKMKLDTGAQVNVLPLRIANEIGIS